LIHYIFDFGFGRQFDFGFGRQFDLFKKI